MLIAVRLSNISYSASIHVAAFLSMFRERREDRVISGTAQGFPGRKL